MKYITFLVLISSINTFAQIPDEETVTYDKKIYVYDTYEDFKNKNEKYIGDFYGTQWSTTGKNRLNISKDSTKRARVSVSILGIGGGNRYKGASINTNKLWGYRIDDFLFRMKKSSPKIPATIIKIKEKIFYLEGYINLTMMEHNSNRGYTHNSGMHQSGVFYSDDLESKIIDIKKFAANEKKNPVFTSLIKCLKKAKKRVGSQSKFNSYKACIEAF